jgi:hypothetical protein
METCMVSSWSERADGNLLRMQRLMKRAGIKPPWAADVPTTLGWAHAVRRCAFCRMSAECEQWLQGAGASGQYREFCPNAGFFEHAAEEVES